MVSSLAKQYKNLSWYQLVARCLHINMKAMRGECSKFAAQKAVNKLCNDNLASYRLIDGLCWPVARLNKLKINLDAFDKM